MAGLSLLTEIPAPAVAVVAQDDRGRYVMCRIKDGANDGFWGFPGGKVDPGESPAEAAVRELREETDLAARRGRVTRAGYFRYDRWENVGQHYICMYYTCQIRGVPKLMEPSKAYEWQLVSRTRMGTLKLLPGIKDYFSEKEKRVWQD